MSPQRVLIVDDESALRRVFCRLFQTHGYEASAVASANEALEAITEPSPCPDLMLVDIKMPGIDGIALLKALRAKPVTSSIPAILMTGLDVPQSLMDAAAQALGAGRIHPKSGNFDELVSRVRQTLRTPAPHHGVVRIDALKRIIWIGGRRLPVLPARRFDLLCALLRAERPMSREELLQTVWDDSDNPNVVDVTVLRLRQDLKAFPFVDVETTSDGYRLSYSL